MRANRHDSADSEVIAEVVLLSLAVMLAAVVGASVFGLAESLQKTTIIGVTATRLSNGFVAVTYHGGEDTANLKSLQVTVNGSDYGTTVLSLDGGTRPLNVGNSTMLRAPFPNRDHVVAAGKFSDGREQVVLDTFI